MTTTATVIGATVTGLPAAIIILVILALLVIGAFVVVRGIGRGASKAANAVTHHDERG